MNTRRSLQAGTYKILFALLIISILMLFVEGSVVLAESAMIEYVEELDEIQVDYGVPFSELDLPETVTAILENGESVDVGVVWQEGDYNEAIPGPHDIEGILIDLPSGVENPYDIKAEIVVNVYPEFDFRIEYIKAPEFIYLGETVEVEVLVVREDYSQDNTINLEIYFYNDGESIARFRGDNKLEQGEKEFYAVLEWTPEYLGDIDFSVGVFQRGQEPDGPIPLKYGTVIVFEGIRIVNSPVVNFGILYVGEAPGKASAYWEVKGDRDLSYSAEISPDNVDLKLDGSGDVAFSAGLYIEDINGFVLSDSDGTDTFRIVADGGDDVLGNDTVPGEYYGIATVTVTLDH